MAISTRSTAKPIDGSETSSAQPVWRDHAQMPTVAVPPAKRAIATGGMWTALTWVLTLSTGPLMTVVLVRAMSAAAFGEFALAASIVGIIAIVSGFGLEATMARFMALAVESGESPAIQDDYGTGRALAGLAAIGTVFLIGAVVLVGQLNGTFRSASPAILLASPVAILAPYKSVYGGALRAVHRPSALSVATILSSIAFAATVLAVIIATGSASARLAAGALSIEVVICVVTRQRAVPPMLRKAARRSGTAALADRPIVSFAAAVLLTGVFALAVAELDVVVLGLVRGTRTVAHYAPLSMTANAVLGLPAIVGAFFMPAAARTLTTDGARGLADLYHWASRWSLVVCAPALAVMIACPAAVMAVLFGTVYPGQVDALRILGMGAASQIFFGFNGLVLDAQGLAAVVAKRQALSLGFSVVLCAVLVPSIGMTGAALATALTLLTANVLCSLSLWRRFRILPWDVSFALSSTVAAIAIAALWVVGGSLAGAWVRTVTTALAVGGSVLIAAAGKPSRAKLADVRSLIERDRLADRRSGPAR